MAYYRPRWLLDLSVPVAGTSAEKTSQETKDSVVRWQMPCRHFRLERNDHTQADVLDVTVDWSFAGLDPRMITDGTCEFHLIHAESDAWGWAPSRKSLRFAGIMQRARRGAAEGESLTVDMMFHDYTSLFLQEKPFVSKGLPDYSQTLSQAWARICDHVGPTDPETGEIKSVVSALRNRIRFVGGASDVQLGKAVAARFRKSKIPQREITDAWAVWQQCVGMVGLISYIYLDECIVTTATDYYTETSSPRLIWGRNIVDLAEERDIRRSREGIIITSFDPLTGTTIEAIWPPIGDTSVRKKHLAAKKKQTADATLQAESRIAFAVPGISDEATLLDVAKRVFEERHRQEFEGHLVTAEMFVEQGDGKGAATPYDLLDLGAGEVIRVEIESDTLKQVLGVNGEESRVEVLIEKGYQPDVARVLVKNLATYASLSPKFFTKRVVAEAETTSEGGSFHIEVSFCNRINVDGSAT